jgi:hypothetical protein
MTIAEFFVGLVVPMKGRDFKSISFALISPLFGDVNEIDEFVDDTAESEAHWRSKTTVPGIRLWRDR